MTKALVRHSVLITGGSGFIGGHLAPKLRAAGCRVTILDPVEPADHDPGEWHRGSVTELGDVRAAMRRINVVVNLAGVSALHSAASEVWEVNAGGTENVTRAASEAGVEYFLHISSDAVYGPRADDGMASERRQIAPMGAYGESKAAAEGLVRRLASSGELRGITLRPFALVGRGQRSRPSGSPLLVAALECAASGAALRIAGNGEQSRDFVDIADLGAAVLTAIDDRIASPDPVNIGSGQDVTINEFVNLVEDATGKTIKRSYERMARPAASGWRADMTRRNEVFPRIARGTLRSAIARAIDVPSNP